MIIFRRSILLAFQILLVAAVFSCEVSDVRQTTEVQPTKRVQAKGQTIPIPDKVIVYYFHGDYRCRTCTLMEQLADQAINEGFAEQLKSGQLEWRIVNTDKEENRHYNQDFQLFTKSLVLVAESDGKQLRYKNCEKIWDKVKNPPDYITYIQGEISLYLEGR